MNTLPLPPPSIIWLDKEKPVLAWKCRSHSTARWAYFATRRCRFCQPVTDAAEVPRGLLS